MKGNKFKSNKLALPRPRAIFHKEPASLYGIKIMFVDKTIRDEYIQLAGYLMVKCRIKMTMTYHFCFFTRSSRRATSRRVLPQCPSRFCSFPLLIQYSYRHQEKGLQKLIALLGGRAFNKMSSIHCVAKLVVAANSPNQTCTKSRN